MAKIDLTNTAVLYNWQDGNMMKAADYKKEREALVVAINDNYDRIKELENATQVTVPKEFAWEATEGQFQFTITNQTFPDIPFILEVSMEGFVLTETEEFTKINNTTIELSEPVSAGTRVYARWYEVRSLKMFTDDLSTYNIMGVF
jgi:hypothetical protein